MKSSLELLSRFSYQGRMETMLGHHLLYYGTIADTYGAFDTASKIITLMLGWSS